MKLQSFCTPLVCISHYLRRFLNLTFLSIVTVVPFINEEKGNNKIADDTIDTRLAIKRVLVVVTLLFSHDSRARPIFIINIIIIIIIIAIITTIINIININRFVHRRYYMLIF